MKIMGRDPQVYTGNDRAVVRPAAERLPNREQQAVIDELDRNIILFASAGTGKTFTVAKRVSRILAEKRALPEEILCLTFTIKAAKEMKDDVLQYVGDAGEDVVVKTIHSFCYQVLREESKRTSDAYCEPMVCDDTDESDMLAGVLTDMGMAKRRDAGISVFHVPNALNNFMSGLKHTRELLGFFGDDEAEDFRKTYEHIKNGDRQQYAKMVRFYDPVAHSDGADGSFLDLMESSVGDFAHRYCEKLRKSELLDFDDLICGVHRLMQTQACRDYWRGRYKYFIIDEMQDTSELEYDTLRQMVGGNHIMMCGDFFQTIYEWRGSRPEKVINAYMEEFATVRFMFMQNYRSTGTLTMATFGYLKNTYRELVGKYCPPDIVTMAPEQGEKILYAGFGSIADEAEWIYGRIRRDCPTDPTKLCIMARSNSYISRLYDELVSVSLRDEKDQKLHFFTVDRDSKFFRKPVIKDVMAFINLVLNRTDAASMTRIVKGYVAGIGEGTITAIERNGEAGISLCSFLDRALYDCGDPYQPLIDAFDRSQIVVFDTETTGLDIGKDQIVQLSAIRLDRNGEITGKLNRFVIPTIAIDKAAQATHHLTYEKIVENGGIRIEDALREFSDFVRGCVLVGHNSIRFDCRSSGGCCGKTACRSLISRRATTR